MKLYTEEQVMKILFTTKQWGNLSNDYLIATVIPIELPSDEEIEDYAKEFVLSHDFSALTNPNHLANRCFQLGAKWMKEQILNQNEG
jgi:hypothetical protein